MNSTITRSPCTNFCAQGRVPVKTTGHGENMSAVSEEDRLRRARQPALLDYAFRPMFLAAGSGAVIALALWLAMFFGYVQLPTRFDPLAWHIHEMLFGFVMAAVAGFLLDGPAASARLSARRTGRPLAAGSSCLPDFGGASCVVYGPCRSRFSRRAHRRRYRARPHREPRHDRHLCSHRRRRHRPCPAPPGTRNS